MKPQVERPDIFRYHDYQGFLRDWLAYRKASQSGFSLRALAKQAGLAAGYLPMVLGGKRPLTAKALAKLAPHLELTASEQSFLENLLVLGTSDSPQARFTALERMKRFHAYSRNNRREAEVYEYLAHWYYVAIREMAALPDFKLDPEWIRSRLRMPVSLSEVKDALEFLAANGYIEPQPDGTARLAEKALDCTSGVYRIALAKFHREIFDLAARSIEQTPSSERNIQGHTFAISEKNYDKAQEIVEEAMRQIRQLEARDKDRDSVYHMEIALFPMTQRRNSG